MLSLHESQTVANPAELYLHDLQLYKYYPHGTILFEELEVLCMQRVEVLLYVEKIHKQTGIKRTPSQCKEILVDVLKKDGYDLFAKIVNGASKEFGYDKDKVLQLRRQDHITHFLLRMAFVSHERRWFHVQELRLFYWRLFTATIEEMKEFLCVNELKTHSISEEDKRDLKEYIKVNNLCSKTPFYKVPFSLVMDLVEMRKVFLKHGMAFVPEKELARLCFGYFTENLSLGLKSISMIAAEAAYDVRINRIFCTVTKYITLQKAKMQRNNGPALAELDDVSKISYPMCMRVIHEKLRKTHHLMHGERSQYSLFLKSIGVTLDDAIELWKQEFTKKIDAEKFEKEYGYRLRHIYGQKGSQKEYKCYQCSRIIDFDINQTESYGCPFKYLTRTSLRQKLNEYKVVPGDIEDIVKKSSLNKYQEACKKYHETMHNCNLNEIFYTPVYYFNESQKRLQYINKTKENNNSKS